MKRVCKQCGKSFELSNSEIAFYKSKNLHLPKRCKECRQANKRGQDGQEEWDWNVRKQDRDVSVQNGDRISRWVYVLIAVSILLLLGLTRISNWLFSPNSARPSVVVENENVDTGITAENEKTGMETAAGSEKSGADAAAGSEKSGTDVSSENEKAGTKELPQSETAAVEDTLQETGNGPEPQVEEQPEENVDTAVPLQSAESDTQQYTFRNSNLLNEHFEKHGKEMGFSSAEEYLAAANAVVNNASALHKTEKEDGDDVYYLEATNEFVIVSTDGFIRTYFYPNAGIDYYNRQ